MPYQAGLNDQVEGTYLPPTSHPAAQVPSEVVTCQELSVLTYPINLEELASTCIRYLKQGKIFICRYISRYVHITYICYVLCTWVYTYIQGHESMEVRG